MPIISKIRKGSRLLNAQVFLIYTVLTIGAAAMVYPFLVMVAGSFKSNVDSTSFDIVPAYFYNDETLLKKYAEARYNENILLYNMVTGANIPEFKEIRRPVPGYAGKLLPEWEQFLKTKEMPYPFYQIGQSHSLGFMPQLRRGFSEYVYKRFNGNLEDYNSACNSNITAWYYSNIPLERFYEKSYLGEDSYAYRLFKDFKGKQDKRHRIYLSVENMYRYGYLALKYGSLVEDYNIAHGTNYGSYSDIMLSETVPQKPGMEREDWLDFVRNNLNRAFIEVAPQSITAYHSMLKDKYDDDIVRLNHSYRKSYAGFDQVPLTADRYTAGTPMVDYDQFVMTAAPEGLQITGPDILFRHYLAGKYGSIAVLNRELHTGYRSFARIGMPAREYDYITMMRYKRDIKTEFITRNYKMVLNYILLHGRGVFNTLVFCLFSIAISLTVNPVSAYALSRYDLPSTFKILLFMMATMAFPAAV
ncbi:MAG: hypothetical protein PHT33_11615, partial [bacterium]|nr:hypothetical protein [bacterium]